VATNSTYDVLSHYGPLVPFYRAGRPGTHERTR